MLIRLMRSPEGGDSAGTAVIEAPETATAEKATPETEGAEPKTETKAEKPKVTDWDIYQKIRSKENNPNAKYSKEEKRVADKYLGKEEHQIAGYKKAQGTPEPEGEPAKAKAEEPEEVEVDPLEPVYKAVGAKDKKELSAKVTGLVNEVKALSGIKGDIGRVLKEAGVPDIKTLREELNGARKMHQIIQDAQAGKAEAIAFLKLKAPVQERFSGEIPEGVLDDGLFRHMSPQLKAANDRADALERKLAAIEGKLAPWEKSQAETSAVNTRNQQKSGIITETAALVDATEGLWDSKKSGSLAKALNEYYDTPADAAHHPDLKPILEILDIAKEFNLPNLDIALAYWERKNGGSLIAKARAEAREPFVGKAPNVGLSDRQGSHNGQFKSFTESDVKQMAAGQKPIPKEWKDRQGNLVKSQVPRHLHGLIFEE